MIVFSAPFAWWSLSVSEFIVLTALIFRIAVVFLVFAVAIQPKAQALSMIRQNATAVFL